MWSPTSGTKGAAPACCTKSIKNVQSSQQSSDRSCFCTNTITTHTRQNKPYRLGVLPAGVVGARGRCCPAATVPVAVVFACGVCCCIAEEIQNKIIDRKKSSAIIVHQAKGTATSTRTTHRRVSKMGFWVCGSGGVFESCTFYLHDGRANRGCRSGLQYPRYIRTYTNRLLFVKPSRILSLFSY